MTVYISGSITGNPNYQYEFADAARRLRDAGYVVINPIELDKSDPPDLLTWEGYLARDLRYMMGCTHIFMLPGWEGSKGARLEREFAREIGMGEIHADDL